MDTPSLRSLLALMLVSFPPLVQAQLDFGDAPATYQTLLPGGARHTVVLSGPRMGSLIDPEADGQPGSAAQGDDGATLDDEDGVTSPLQWEANTLVTIQITVNKACRLGWTGVVTRAGAVVWMTRWIRSRWHSLCRRV